MLLILLPVVYVRVCSLYVCMYKGIREEGGRSSLDQEIDSTFCNLIQSDHEKINDNLVN